MAPTESLDGTDTNDGEITNEISTPEKPGLKEIVGAELQALALEGMRLKQLIAEAKTQPKKKLYEKKLKKNSKKAAELILYLERLQIGEAIEQHNKEQEFIDTRNPEDATPRGRTSEESAQA